MKKIHRQNLILSLSFLFLFFICSCFTTESVAQSPSNEGLNVVIFGAHPDDPEKVGGIAAKWIEHGGNVLMVAMTNGDAGHQSIPPVELARIRREEARNAGKVIGAKYITLDNHDGKLMPTYENREQVIKIIREHNADIVISPRPYDYHPDHRYTGVLVMDAAYMVTVPRIVPEEPFLTKNPLFLWMSDGFIHPEPFEADVAIDIDDVIEKKIDMYDAHVSQLYEWLPFNRGNLDEVPKGEKERRAWLGDTWKSNSNAEQYREKLIEIYGETHGNNIKYCEALQDSGYGTRLTKDNMKYYFPFIE